MRRDIATCRFASRIFVGFLVVYALSTAIQAAEFVPLGFLPGGAADSRVEGSSADGSVVVGTASKNGRSTTFRWTRDDGMLALSDSTSSVQAVIVSADGSAVSWSEALYQTLVWSEPTGMQTVTGFQAFNIIADGSVVIGKANESVPGGVTGNSPARWTVDGGIEGLPKPPGGRDGPADFITPDGATITGLIRDESEGGSKPFRWTSGEGSLFLGETPGHNTYRIHGMSDDGTAVVGSSWSTDAPASTPGASDLRALWRWSTDNGFEVIDPSIAEYGFRFNNDGFSDPSTLDRRALSADGSKLAGAQHNSNNSIVEAICWTATGGIQVIEGIPGSLRTLISDMSADGNVLLGLSDMGDSNVAWLWTEATGARSLEDIITQQGLADATIGWDLSLVREITDDGNALIGHGTNPDGNTEAFVIYLDPLAIPEPNSLLLCGLAVIGLGVWRRLPAQGVSLAITLCVLTSTTQAAEFVPLGFLVDPFPGGGGTLPGARASFISDDGLVVSGDSPLVVDENSFIRAPYRWTRETGMVALADNKLNGQVEMSRDGSVQVWTGTDYVTNIWSSSSGLTTVDLSANADDFPMSVDGTVLTISGASGFGRWTPATGFEVLGTPWDTIDGRALSSLVSGDGSVIVGTVRRSNSQGGGRPLFKWSQSDGFSMLGEIPGHDFYELKGISFDGSSITGISESDSGESNLWRWTDAGGLEVLHEAGTGFEFERNFSATWMSDDGSVIAGAIFTQDRSHVSSFRWTESSGYELLPHLPEIPD